MPAGCSDDTSEPECDGSGEVDKKWGGYDHSNDAYSNVDGEKNTNNIHSRGWDTLAAEWCYDLELNGYSDWYLPAKEELNTLYNNRTKVGQLDDEEYWSSTEYDSKYAYYKTFSDIGSMRTDSKDVVHSIRCVRNY